MAAAPNPGIGPVWPVSVKTYHAMLDKGILNSGDRVELLDGIIVEKPVVNPPHRISTRLARQALDRVVPPGWYVDEQKPITLHTSEPEPDIAVIRGNTRDYFDRHPGAGDVGLAMEIADSSLDRDRIFKKRIYAAAGIPYYWLLNLNTRSLEVYSEPMDGEYTRRIVYKSSSSVEVLLDGKIAGTVRVRDLLP
jgi:Uma2 family endonuclease